MHVHKIAVAAIAMSLGIASGSPVAGGGGNLRIGITIVPTCDIHRPERRPADPARAVRVSCASRVPYRISHSAKPGMVNPPRITAAATAGSGSGSGATRVILTTVTF